MTGDLGFQEQVNEAEVMSQYLQNQHHIAESRILLEDQSTGTEQNSTIASLCFHPIKFR